MSKNAHILTRIVQAEVRILSDKDFEGYDYNKPSVGRWELIEYINSRGEDGKPIRMWQPVYEYTFNTPKIDNHNKVKEITLE
jgi:hypothetical protein